MEIIQFELKMEGDGIEDGKDENPNNPLNRAMDGILEKGKPDRIIHKCFFRDSNGKLRWLGVFVYSAGARVIFFPGYDKKILSLIADKNGEEVWNKAFQLDHISLEKDKESWHFTEPNSKRHIGKFYTEDMSNGGKYWFSLSVSTEKELYPVYEHTIISSECHENDTKRRSDLLLQSQANIVDNIIELNREVNLETDQKFLHFIINIGDKGFDSDEDLIASAPIGSIFHNGKAEKIDRIPLRTHRAAISDVLELEIISTEIKGKLSSALVFSGKSSIQ